MPTLPPGCGICYTLIMPISRVLHALAHTCAAAGGPAGREHCTGEPPHGQPSHPPVCRPSIILAVWGLYIKAAVSCSSAGVCHTYGRPLRVPLLPHQVVRTNLLGSLLATQAAMRHMAAQPGGGHIFNFEGAGSDGAPTPQVGAPLGGAPCGGRGQGVQPACSGELQGAACKLLQDLCLAPNLRATDCNPPTSCDNLPSQSPRSTQPTALPRQPLRSCCARCRPRRPPCRARRRRRCGCTTCLLAWY